MNNFHRALLLITLLASPMAMAKGKFQTAFGYYSLKAETGKASGTRSGAGSYQIAYKREFMPQLEVGVGYSLIVEKTFTGDKGFGPDFGIFYYPFTTTEGIRYENQDTVIISSEKWRPYAGVNFHHRQYQSTESSYAGFSVTVGTEYDWSTAYSFKAELRQMSLSGPSNASANQMDLLLGISIPL